MHSSTSCFRATAGPLLPDDGGGRRQVVVPFERFSGWAERFAARHPGTAWTVSGGALQGTSDDGTRLQIEIPWAAPRLASIDDVSAHLLQPWHVGVVIVRRGGFAVAHAVGAELVDVKVGKRHVQGKTKAGGWSQQRFANRRANQAKVAFDAAADHTGRLLLPHAGRLRLLGTGGDRRAVATVVAQPRLAALAGVPQQWLGGLGDPDRAVVQAAVGRARSVTIEVEDPIEPDH